MHLDDKCIFWRTPASALPSQSGGKKSWTVSSWLNCTFIPGRGQWQLEEAILNLEISSIFTMQDFFNFFFWPEPNNRSRTIAAELLGRDILQMRVTENSCRALRQPKIRLGWWRLTASSITNLSPARAPQHTLRFWHHDQNEGGSLHSGRWSLAPIANKRRDKSRSIWGARGCATLRNKDTADWFLCRHRQRSKRRSESMEISNPVRISAFIGDQ